MAQKELEDGPPRRPRKYTRLTPAPQSGAGVVLSLNESVRMSCIRREARYADCARNSATKSCIEENERVRPA
jgi:hypothetical protein